MVDILGHSLLSMFDRHWPFQTPWPRRRGNANLSLGALRSRPQPGTGSARQAQRVQARDPVLQAQGSRPDIGGRVRLRRIIARTIPKRHSLCLWTPRDWKRPWIVWCSRAVLVQGSRGDSSGASASSLFSRPSARLFELAYSAGDHQKPTKFARQRGI